MKDGFVKVACASPRLRVADPAYNADEILRLIEAAAEQCVSVLVLPELALTGKTCGDLFLQKRLIDECEAQIGRIVAATASGSVAVVLGAPVAISDKLYNAALVAADGKLVGVVPKSVLSPEEERCFSVYRGDACEIKLGEERTVLCANAVFCCDAVKNLRLAVEIGEELWSTRAGTAARVADGATVVACLGAEPEMIGTEASRRARVSARSAGLACAYLYAGAASGESTTDGVYAGHDMIVENGALLAEYAPFAAENELLVSEIDLELLINERRRTAYLNENGGSDEVTSVELPFSLLPREVELTRFVDPHPFIPQDAKELRARCRRMMQIQAEGLARRIERADAAGMVIGISGGLDSCLALLVAVKAAERLGMDKKQILAVTMPCFGTTRRTRQNAEVLCEELGVSFREVSIADSVRTHFAAIGHDENDRNVVFENAQARERTQVIMDIANGVGALVVGTGDLSELALGWATYNGDHMSMYGVNASVPKTLVRYGVAVCALEAEEEGKDRLRDTLKDILDTPVSPELLPADGEKIAQVTEDLVGPYELHDFFLYHMVRRGETPKKIFRLACRAFGDRYEKRTVLHWLTTFCRRFFTQQFKRSCLPDGPKVGSVSLSPRGDLRMPSDASYQAWMRELEELSEEIR